MVVSTDRELLTLTRQPTSLILPVPLYRSAINGIDKASESFQFTIMHLPTKLKIPMKDSSSFFLLILIFYCFGPLLYTSCILGWLLRQNKIFLNYQKKKKNVRNHNKVFDLFFFFFFFPDDCNIQLSFDKYLKIKKQNSKFYM